jgi:hypothetical protein
VAYLKVLLSGIRQERFRKPPKTKETAGNRKTGNTTSDLSGTPSSSV